MASVLSCLLRHCIEDGTGHSSSSHDNDGGPAIVALGGGHRGSALVAPAPPPTIGRSRRRRSGGRRGGGYDDVLLDEDNDEETGNDRSSDDQGEEDVFCGQGQIQRVGSGDSSSSTRNAGSTTGMEAQDIGGGGWLGALGRALGRIGTGGGIGNDHSSPDPPAHALHDRNRDGSNYDSLGSSPPSSPRPPPPAAFGRLALGGSGIGSHRSSRRLRSMRRSRSQPISNKTSSSRSVPPIYAGGPLSTSPHRSTLIRAASSFERDERQGTHIPSIALDEIVLPGSGLQKQMAESMKSSSVFELQNDEEDECVICMENFTDDNPRMPTLCGCGENRTYFHLPCLYEWIERDANCPSCRKRLRWEEF